MKKFIFAALTLIFLFSSSVSAKEYAIKDVPNEHLYYEQIQQALNENWMSLVKGKFYPNKNVTKGEFAVILAKVTGNANAKVKTTKSTFIDVSKKDPYFKYIELMQNYIPYKKTSKGKIFNPKSYITRQETATAIVKAMGFDSEDSIQMNGEIDISLDEYIEDAKKISPALRGTVAIAIGMDLIEIFTVNDKDYFYPTKAITRAQMANILTNSYSYDDPAEEEDGTTDNDDETNPDQDSQSMEYTISLNKIINVYDLFEVTISEIKDTDKYQANIVNISGEVLTNNSNRYYGENYIMLEHTGSPSWMLYGRDNPVLKGKPETIIMTFTQGDVKKTLTLYVK